MVDEYPDISGITTARVIRETYFRSLIYLSSRMLDVPSPSVSNFNPFFPL